MIRDNLNQLIDIVTSENHQDEIIDARNQYQLIAGKIYEDDKSYENRMALFLEWYIFDRIFPDTNQTILETLKQKNKENNSSDSLQIFNIFNINIQGLFIVKRIKDKTVKVVNLFDNNLYEASETMGNLIFSKGDIFQGRLIYHNKNYYFTGNFCFHPEKAKGFIKRAVKRVNVDILENKKYLKLINRQFNDEQKKADKVSSKIEKLNSQLLESPSDARASKIGKNIEALKNNLSQLKENLFTIESKIKTIASEESTCSPKALQIKLIQQISYMQLVWERSRHIDIENIYRN